MARLQGLEEMFNGQRAEFEGQRVEMARLQGLEEKFDGQKAEIEGQKVEMVRLQGLEEKLNVQQAEFKDLTEHVKGLMEWKKTVQQHFDLREVTSRYEKCDLNVCGLSKLQNHLCRTPRAMVQTAKPKKKMVDMIKAQLGCFNHVDKFEAFDALAQILQALKRSDNEFTHHGRPSEGLDTLLKTIESKLDSSAFQNETDSFPSFETCRSRVRVQILNYYVVSIICVASQL